MKKTEVMLKIQLDDERELGVILSVEIGSTGIGAYEFHGMRGFDRGQPCIEDWNIDSTVDMDTGKEVRNFADWEVKFIEKEVGRFIDSGDVWDQIEEEE